MPSADCDTYKAQITKCEEERDTLQQRLDNATRSRAQGNAAAMMRRGRSPKSPTRKKRTKKRTKKRKSRKGKKRKSKKGKKRKSKRTKKRRMRGGDGLGKGEECDWDHNCESERCENDKCT